MNIHRNPMRRTEIVCTVDPANESTKRLEDLVQSGMDVARLNLSHGTLQGHHSKITSLGEISKRLRRNGAMLQDLAGPKIIWGARSRELFSVRFTPPLGMVTKNSLMFAPGNPANNPFRKNAFPVDYAQAQ